MTANQPPIVHDLEFLQHGLLGDYELPRLRDVLGNPVSLASKALTLSAYAPEDPDTVVFTLTTGNSDLAIGGSDNNRVTIQADDTNTATARVLRYVIRNTTDDKVIYRGLLRIRAAADVS